MRSRCRSSHADVAFRHPLPVFRVVRCSSVHCFHTRITAELFRCTRTPNAVSAEESDDILEVLPPVTEEEEEEGDEMVIDQPPQQEVQEQEEIVIAQARRPSAKFDLQDPEEGRPLKSKRSSNINTLNMRTLIRFLFFQYW
ncbi:UNVERIFIED_CONTAM: hypothetical protein NCL1_18979 [Trichonephila clavipes]